MKNILITILLLTILVHVFGKSIKEKNLKTEINFKSEVKKFCFGKSTNFCSEEHIRMMFMIEEKRLQQLEMARQMKRMEKEIIRNIFNHFKKQ